MHQCHQLFLSDHDLDLTLVFDEKVRCLSSAAVRACPIESVRLGWHLSQTAWSWQWRRLSMHLQICTIIDHYYRRRYYYY